LVRQQFRISRDYRRFGRAISIYQSAAGLLPTLHQVGRTGLAPENEQANRGHILLERS
jgi:hypothetical protein